MRVYRHPLPYLLTILAASCAALALLMTLSVILSLRAIPTGELTQPFQIGAWSVDPFLARTLGIAFWTIAPPLWFFIEYFWLFKRFSDPDKLELFKHGQQVSASIWAGVVAFLIAFYKL
ncbi:MAG: hypothetical protein U1F68_10610 [Gammaproteobacteria bacterium]